MSRSHTLALVLFAIGLPLGTWMHDRATTEGIRLAQSDAHADDERALDRSLREARTQRFLTEARDPTSSCAARASALHFLADEDHEAPELRAWAKQELAQRGPCRVHEHDDTLGPLLNDPKVHDDVVKLFGNLECNETLKELVRLGLETDEQPRD
ncbi:MAG TPA: hypothetical protein VG755_37570 [Nannocystaceae bacterium]|nr:hypothetical protein [Nannocystaceae bacterium]